MTNRQDTPTPTSRRTSFTDGVIDNLYDAVEGIDCLMSILPTSPSKPADINSEKLYCLLNPHQFALRAFMKEFDEISEGYREYALHMEEKRVQALMNKLLKSKKGKSRKAGGK